MTSKPSAKMIDLTTQRAPIAAAIGASRGAIADGVRKRKIDERLVELQLHALGNWQE
jgi:hypothetical protein